MPLTAVVPKRTGRPRAKEGTVRIMKSGVARLSPDLCIGSEFTMHVDMRKKTIVLKKVVNSSFDSGQLYALWYSSKDAKSGLISITSALKQLSLSRVEGLFAAKKTEKTITINLKHKLGA